jgi:Fe-S-cluster-containing hydrogenase component 2
MDTCPTGAIRLDREADMATIDLALCNACLVCLDACPNGAIQQVESSELIPVVEGEIVERPVTPVPVATFPRRLGRSGQLAALTGTALSFVGSWLLPRAVDVLLDAFERRLAGGSRLSSRSLSLRADNQPLMRSGRGGTRSRSRQRHRRRQGW